MKRMLHRERGRDSERGRERGRNTLSSTDTQQLDNNQEEVEEMTTHKAIATSDRLRTGWEVRDIKSKTMTERENPKLKKNSHLNSTGGS